MFQKPVRHLTHLRETIRGNRQMPMEKVKIIEKEETVLKCDTSGAVSESVPSHINPVPMKLTELHEVGIGDLITIEFTDTQNA